MNHIVDDILNTLMHYGTPRRSGRYPWGSGDSPYQRTGDFLSRSEKLKAEGKTDNEVAKLMGLSSGEYRTLKSLANAERRSLMYDTAVGLKKDGLNNTEIARKMGLPNESSVRSLLDEKSKDKMQASMKAADFLRERVDDLGMIEVGKGVNKSLNLTDEKMREALYILELDGYPTHKGRVPQATNPGQMTTISVLCPPGTPNNAIYEFDKINMIADKYISRDNGETFDKLVYPKSMDSNRLKIRYAEEGGDKKDGVLEIRRNVEDLSLGKSRYAQVRILVDDDRYLKGMAIYSDDMSDGADIVFNTNKKQGTPTRDVLKKISNDPDNPFGSLIKAGGQNYYIDKDGNRQLSLINKRAEEGDWEDWTDSLPSQFLSKQPKELIQKQLNLAKADKAAEFEETLSLVNPTVRKKMLYDFAEDCDAAAVQLKAAALPRQKYKVILPINSLKDTEVYAPTFINGEKVALIRYPHGGTFEIPILKVNNKHKEAKRILGNPADAIGINSKVAERLSGADFDGDTVMVIPTGGKVNILSTKSLEALENFDPKKLYKATRVEELPDGKKRCFRGDSEFRPMTNTQTEMGKISNLITDMTLKGASEGEIAKAVKHSMVVIDAEKHDLDYKQSYEDNNIAALKKRWQGRVEDGKYRDGASTLISRSSSEVSVEKRKGSPKINPETGELVYKLASEPYNAVRYKDPVTGKLVKPSKDQMREYKSAIANGKKPKDFVVQVKQDGAYDLVKLKDPKTGKGITPSKEKRVDPVTGKTTSDYSEMMKSYREAVDSGKGLDNYIVKNVTRTQASTQGAEAKDVRTLSSGTLPEELYADYANYMKSLANSARKEYISTKDIPYSPEAKVKYQHEVKSLHNNLNIAEKNAPVERFANIMAAATITAKKEAYPEMSKSELKKVSQRALVDARNTLGAKRTTIPISAKEWEAIQAGAVSATMLKDIMNHVDSDELRAIAMPKTTSTLTVGQMNKIKALIASGHTTDEIAQQIGKSATTINNFLLGKGAYKD